MNIPDSGNLPHQRKYRFAFSALLLLIAAAFGTWYLQKRQTESSMPSMSNAKVVSGIGAIGRLEPGWKMIQIGPSSTPDGARIETLFAGEGSLVRAGDVVAIMDTRSRKEAALDEAKAQVRIAAAKLVLTKAGVKAQDIAAQEAAVEHLRASLQKVEAEYKRIKALEFTGAVSVDEYDQRRFQVLMAAATLRQSEATLASMKVVRKEDVLLAEAELARAQAGVAMAEADLEVTQIRYPGNGRILKVNAYPGEKVSESGIFELGDTSQMHAVAEVYEKDIVRVQIGQRATVWMQSIPGELTGKVVHVGWKVGRRVVLDNDPVKDTDAKVVEVRIQLDSESSERVSGLSYARVEIRIDIAGGP